MADRKSKDPIYKYQIIHCWIAAFFRFF